VIFVGFLKRNKKLVKLTYWIPKDLWVLSNVDSNYTTNKETRRSVSMVICDVGGTIVNWLSKMKQSVMLFSMEAKYMSLASVLACECKFLQ
jgi:hypothetical protein